MWLWLTACIAMDRQAPEIRVEGPDHPVRQAATFVISARDADPGLRRIMLSVDDRTELLPIPTRAPEVQGLEWVYGVEALREGVHEVRFTAMDASWRNNRAAQIVEVQVDRKPPGLDVAAISQTASQGHTLPVWVRADEPLSGGRIEVFGNEYPLFPMEGELRALVGVAIRTEPGPHRLRVRARDLAGNEGETEVDVFVEVTEFEDTGTVGITRRDIDAERDDDAKDAMRVARDRAFAKLEPLQSWEGPFGLPVAYGTPAAPFGRYFSYQDGERSYHDGLDLEKRDGARISAAAAGEVVLAGGQPIFGKVVIVDHGQGVKTSYNHLGNIAVEVGDRVEKGAALGTMGVTGQTYGPHLHWGLVVGGTAVDPAEWLEDDFSSSPFR